jgi:prophage tail gpP-like protein
VIQDQVKNGDRLSVSIDGALQLSGIIDGRGGRSSHGGTSMILSGLDVSGIAMESDADPTIQLRGASIEDALADLFEPLRVKIHIIDAAAAREVQSLRNRRHGAGVHRVNRRTRFDAFKVRPGDKIWQLSDTICRHAGYMIWTAPYSGEGAGVGLVVDKPADSGPPRFLFEQRRDDNRFSGNVMSASYDENVRGIPTEVTAFTHTAANASGDTRMRTVVFNDGLVHPHVVTDLLPRPRFLRADQARTVQRATKAAERDIAKAMSHFRVYECEVQGHAQDTDEGRAIYTINTIAHVRDDRFSLDEDMLMTSVNFKGSREGQTTSVRMVPKGAIKVIPDA